MAGNSKSKAKLENNISGEQAEVVPETPVPQVPQFWDGVSPIGLGMALKQDGYTAVVVNIFNCINGAVIIGQTLHEGVAHNIFISRPKPHKLASWPRETPEQIADLEKYWGFDIQ